MFVWNFENCIIPSFNTAIRIISTVLLYVFIREIQVMKVGYQTSITKNKIVMNGVTIYLSSRMN
jgi:hypothetical protein